MYENYFELRMPGFITNCCVVVMAASVGLAQAQPDDAAATTPAVTVPAAVNDSTATPAAATPAATPPAATTPAARPRMGLVVPLTAPRSKPRPVVKGAVGPSRYQNTRGTEKANNYYRAVWGVDRLKASYTSSGNLIKFSYRVLQPKLAATLGNHEYTPELVGIRSNAVLHVPNMEKIGQLRQMSAAEADKEYWMVFSNKGNLVKAGDEVSVIIGKFRADGLIVE